MTKNLYINNCENNEVQKFTLYYIKVQQTVGQENLKPS